MNPTAKAANILLITDEIQQEVLRASSLHAPMNSPHEAEGVIREEFEEFWDEVKKFNPAKGRDTRPAMREELIQLAAMAIRAISDVIDKPDTRSMFLPPLPEGVVDTLETRARLQAFVEGRS